MTLQQCSMCKLVNIDLTKDSYILASVLNKAGKRTEYYYHVDHVEWNHEFSEEDIAKYKK
jgi:hypothetical protein